MGEIVLIKSLIRMYVSIKGQSWLSYKTIVHTQNTTTVIKETDGPLISRESSILTSKSKK